MSTEPQSKHDKRIAMWDRSIAHWEESARWHRQQALECERQAEKARGWRYAAAMERDDG